MNKSLNLVSYKDVRQLLGLSEKEYEIFTLILKKVAIENKSFVMFKRNCLMEVLDAESETELIRKLDDIILRPFKYKTKDEVISFHIFTGYSIDNTKDLITIDINEKFESLIKNIDKLNKNQVLI